MKISVYPVHSIYIMNGYVWVPEFFQTRATCVSERD